MKDIITIVAFVAAGVLLEKLLTFLEVRDELAYVDEEYKLLCEKKK